MRRLWPECFTFELWRAGSLATFKIETRSWSIAQNCGLVRRHAEGYCPGLDLFVRPKPGVAVMFRIDERDFDDRFWTHLSYNEFAYCFPEIDRSQYET